jgi:uncharacterized membrane protein HdeD (DUF308 family)
MLMVMERPIANKGEAINLRARFLVLGVCLVALGVSAITAAAVSTIMTVLFLGCFLIAGGIAHVVHAIQARRFGRLALDLSLAAVYVLAGAALIYNPVAGALSATLVMSIFLGCMGIAKVAYAMSMRQFLFRYWGWLLLAGFIDMLLSGLVCAGWPSTAQWVLGLFAGIQMVFHGGSLLVLAAACNHLKLYVLE